MLLLVLGAIAVCPVYWLVVPARWRRCVLTVVSLVALGVYDRRLLVLVPGTAFGLYGLMRLLRTTSAVGRRVLTGLGLLALLVLFVWNKRAGTALAVLPSQSGLVLLGVSYLVLKAVAALVEAARGTIERAGVGELLAWIAFLPTYPAGPIEDLDHFREQQPSRARVLEGLERILIGLVKALLLAAYLGTWADGVVAAPGGHARGVLLLALYAFTLRFYLDFSGYSDIAIGVAALFGWQIEENFDAPLVRRNLVQLWQRWHMTLTRWLRVYLFIPVTRWLMRDARAGDRTAAALGQAVTMTACGLWHGLAWNFALWGLLQAVGLVWVGLVARDLGRRLPAALVGWWRRSPLAYALSTAITFNAFALSLVFVIADVPRGLRYLGLLLGP